MRLDGMGGYAAPKAPGQITSRLLSSEWSEHDFKLGCTWWCVESTVLCQNTQKTLFGSFSWSYPAALCQHGAPRPGPYPNGVAVSPQHQTCASVAVPEYPPAHSRHHALLADAVLLPPCPARRAIQRARSTTRLQPFFTKRGHGRAKKEHQGTPKPCPQAADNLSDTQIPHQRFPVAALRQFHPHPKPAASRCRFWQSLGSLWTTEFRKGHMDNYPICYCPHSANYGSKHTYCSTTEIVINCVPRADVPGAKSPWPLESNLRLGWVQHL